jgi:CHAT domain-containing protein/tetratricopeptide (TPR) repeat protein
MLAVVQICLATIVSFSILGLTQTSSAPDQKLRKQGDVVKQQQIKGGETKTFFVTLTAGDYATLRTEQHGSILLVTLFDPQGKKLIQMDYAAGGHGPILISTIASLSGDYRLEIYSPEEWAKPSEVEVVLDERRSPRAEDQVVLDAQQAFADGRKNFAAKNFDAALSNYKQALNLWTAANNEHWQALTHLALRQTYGAIGESERPNTIKELETLLALVNQHLAPNDWRIKAVALNDLGSQYRQTGQIERAVVLLQEAYELFLSHGDRRGQASSLNNLAIIHGITGNYSLARELVEKALALRYAENDRAGAANVLNSLVAISNDLGEPDKALEYLERARKEWQTPGELSPDDQGRLANLLNSLAAVSDKLGQWEKARDYYDQALAMFSEGDPNRAATLDNKGELYASFGDLKKARECYDQALSIMPAEKFNVDIKAGILVHLGQLFYLQGDLTNAVAAFEQARELKLRPRRLADVLTNLGIVLVAQKKPQDAMLAYNKALDIQLSQKDKRGEALTLQKRSETYNLLKQHQQATDDLKRALVLWDLLKDPRGRAATLNTLAQVEQDRGNIKDALDYSDEAISVVESQRTTLSSRELRASYFATQENYYELNIDLNMQLSKSGGDEHVVRAFATAEKARARVLLETLTESGVDQLDTSQTSQPGLATLIEQLAAVRKKLAAKAQARTKFLGGNPNPAQLAALEKEIQTISEKYDSLETQIRSQHRKFATLTRPQPATLKDSQQQLDDDTLLLEYALGNKRSYAWVVSQNSIKSFELAPREQIEKVVWQLRETLTEDRKDKNENPLQAQSRMQQQYSNASSELSKLIIAPVASVLSAKRLVIIPDGALQLIPFASLPVAGPESSLITDHEIIYFPSASILTLQRRELANRKPAAHAVAVLANPVFQPDDERVTEARKKKSEQDALAQSTNQRRDIKSALRDVGVDQLTRLPYSNQEAAAIMNVAPKGEVLSKLGFEATRAAALSPELSKYKIIHFATHGILDLQHPELSAIVLSLVDKNGAPQDGYLFLHDIYNLNLPAELVVLSACQTGIGKQVKGEGLIALTRGFMYAGAARLVASLWKVDDAATAALMKEFYKEMFVNSKKPAAALQAAQIYMRGTRRWNSPVYWAGFFIQGEWR